MNLTTIKNNILETFEVMGYTRTARELLNLSNAQLEDLGLSRALLEKGYSAYPWRESETGQAIPNNVTKLNPAQVAVDTQVKSNTAKAA